LQGGVAVLLQMVNFWRRGIMDMTKVFEILKQILDFCTSKYGAFSLAVCAFFFPVVLFLKCKYEEHINQKFRNRAILQLLADDDYNLVQDESLSQIPQMSVCDYDTLNFVFKERARAKGDFIQNGKPLFSDDSIIIPWQRLRRAYETYNNSLCNGFWSLFLSHAKRDVYTKVGFIQYFENTAKTKSLVLFELIDGEFSKIYRVNLKEEGGKEDA
jgi:hypothetical protein